MATLTGKGVVWAIGDVEFTGLVSGAVDTQSATVRRQAESRQIRDQNGETCGMVFFDHNQAVTITVIPSGASVSAATSNLTSLAPAPGTIITIAADLAVLDTLGAATAVDKYVLLSAEVQLNNEQEATIVMELQQFNTNIVAAAVS